MPLHFICRAISVLWREVIPHRNVMRQITAGPSLEDSKQRSNSSKEAPRHPLQDSRSLTISTGAAAPIPAPTAGHLPPVINFRFLSAGTGCRELLDPTLSPTCRPRLCRQARKVLRVACGRDLEISIIRTTPTDRVVLGAHHRDPVTLA